MLERVQRGAAGREEAKWQKFPPEQRAHEAQHCVHHKSRSVVLIPSNLISPRGSALICQEFFWCRKPPPVHGGREGKKKPSYCFCAVEEEEEEDIFSQSTRRADDLWCHRSLPHLCVIVSLQSRARHTFLYLQSIESFPVLCQQMWRTAAFTGN